MKHSISVLLLTLLTLTLSGQSKDDEIKKLQLLAKENEERAIKAEGLADYYKSEADRAKESLARLRLQALAKIFSTESLEQTDNELAGLLALQAYSFNKQGKGYEFNNDVYAGLTSALFRYGRVPQSLESNYPVTNFLQTKGDAVFSLGNDDNVLKWTNQNNVWQSSELIKINKGSIKAVNVSYSGKLMALGVIVGNQKFHLELFDLTKPHDEPKIIPCGKNTIEQIVFKPDDSGIYCLANAGLSIMFSDFISIKEVIQSNEKISAINVSPDGGRIAGAGATGNLFIWNMTDFSSTNFNVLNEGAGLETLSFSNDGKYIFFGDRKGALYMFSLSSKAVTLQLVGHKYKVDGIAFSQSGKFMATT